MNTPPVAATNAAKAMKTVREGELKVRSPTR
jgi:hypothetical protein